MIRHVVSSLYWRDLVAALAAESWATLAGRADGTQALRRGLAAALQQPDDSVWVTGSGRSALHAVVRASRRTAADQALLPGYTCVVVPQVFTHQGIPVRYVDLPSCGVNPTAEAWEAAIDQDTRWVVVPHNFGVPTLGLAELRARHPHVLFIEDVAHGWGAQFPDGRALGTVGQAAFFSFEYSKCLTAGLGGALLVNDPALRAAVQATEQPGHLFPRGLQARIWLTLAYHLGQAAWPSLLADGLNNALRAMAGVRRLAAQTGPEELSGLAAPDYERRLPGSLARLALVQLRRTGLLIERRRAQAARYRQIWQQSPWVDDLLEGGLLDGANPLPTLLRYPIAVRDPADRLHLRAGLLSMGIEPGAWFDDVVHPAGSLGHGYVAGQCPNGERLARSIVNLPLGLHAELSVAQEAAMHRLAASSPGVLRAADHGACA